MRVADEGVRVLSEKECVELFDKNARHYLGMSGPEFLEKWDAGEIDVDGSDHCNIIPVVMLMPWGRLND